MAGLDSLPSETQQLVKSRIFSASYCSASAYALRNLLTDLSYLHLACWFISRQDETRGSIAAHRLLALKSRMAWMFDLEIFVLLEH